MIKAAFKAITDVLSPEFRSILWRAIGLALGLFIGVILAVEALFWFFTFVRWPWVETLLAIGTGLGLLVLFFFLMAPVTSIFAGLYLDTVAAKVEARHYPRDVPGTPLTGLRAMITSLQFAGVILVANVFALPLVFTGIGIFVLYAINAYLISREYFEMVAMRFMEPDDAKALRKDNAIDVFTSGLIPAAIALVPIVNLVVPLFATSYFVHIFKQVFARERAGR
jgi:CysZ protein